MRASPLLAGVLALAVLRASPASASASPAAEQGESWSKAPGFEATISDQVGDVRVFQSPDFKRLLVLPDKSRIAWLVFLSAGTVESIPSSAVASSGDQVRVSPSAVTDLGKFVRVGAAISFRDGRTFVRIGPEAPLVGDVTLDQILERKPEYAADAKDYKPNATAVRALQAVKQPADIVVFFGTWCPICRKRMPMFLKTLETAGNGNLHVRYVAVDENYAAPRDELTKYNVHITPTFIVLEGGREIGRVNKTPKESLEASLAEILSK